MYLYEDYISDRKSDVVKPGEEIYIFNRGEKIKATYRGIDENLKAVFETAKGKLLKIDKFEVSPIIERVTPEVNLSREFFNFAEEAFSQEKPFVDTTRLLESAGVPITDDISAEALKYQTQKQISSRLKNLASLARQMGMQEVEAILIETQLKIDRNLI